MNPYIEIHPGVERVLSTQHATCPVATYTAVTRGEVDKGNDRSSKPDANAVSALAVATANGGVKSERSLFDAMAVDEDPELAFCGGATRRLYFLHQL